MSPLTDQAETIGRCGDTLNTGTDTFDPRTVCALPHGHQGWHRADNGAEWSRDPASTASAYLVISDRVMGWVDVDRARADEYARNVGGVLVQVPVIADYRPGQKPHRLAAPDAQCATEGTCLQCGLPIHMPDGRRWRHKWTKLVGCPNGTTVATPAEG